MEDFSYIYRQILKQIEYETIRIDTIRFSASSRMPRRVVPATSEVAAKVVYLPLLYASQEDSGES